MEGGRKCLGIQNRKQDHVTISSGSEIERLAKEKREENYTVKYREVAVLNPKVFTTFLGQWERELSTNMCEVPTMSFLLPTLLPDFYSLLFSPTSVPYFASQLLFPTLLPDFYSLLCSPTSIPYFAPRLLFSIKE